MEPVDFIVFALAVWRVSVFIAEEAGPFDFMRRIRERFDVVHDEDGKPVGVPLTGLGKLITCVWCVSLYVTIVFSIIWYFDVNLIYILGLWGAASAIHGLVFRGQ